MPHEIHRQMRYPTDGPMYSIIVGVQFGDMADVDCGKALAMVGLAMTPMPAKDIAAALAKLRALTKTRAEAAIDMEIAVAAYADELRQYPADVVRETLTEWPRRTNGQWWPSWHELDRILTTKADYRRAMKTAIELQAREVA